jgi:hypothetical protein
MRNMLLYFFAYPASNAHVIRYKYSFFLLIFISCVDFWVGFNFLFFAVNATRQNDPVKNVLVEVKHVLVEGKHVN